MLQISLLLMKRLNKTEAPISVYNVVFVGFVLCFQNQSFYFYFILTLSTLGNNFSSRQFWNISLFVP